METYRTTHPETKNYIEVNKLNTFKSKKSALSYSSNILGSFIKKSSSISTYGHWDVFLPVLAD